MSGALFYDGGEPVVLFVGSCPASEREELRILSRLADEYRAHFGKDAEQLPVCISRPVDSAASSDSGVGGIVSVSLVDDDEALVFVVAPEECDIEPGMAKAILQAAREINGLRNCAFLDPLTGVRNRRYAELALDERIKESVRYGLDLSVVMIDIDDFKRANRDGHAEGDRVLRRFTQALQGAVRNSDLLARYGGDEFLLVLPHTDAAGAQILIDRVGKTLAAESFGDDRQWSFSVGIAQLGADGQRASDLVAASDRRLMDSKDTTGVSLESNSRVRRHE